MHQVNDFTPARIAEFAQVGHLLGRAVEEQPHGVRAWLWMVLETIDDLYREVLDRPADLGGLAAYATLAMGGATREDIRQALEASDEYDATIAKPSESPGMPPESPSEGPIEPSPTAAPLVGRLRIDGGAFVDDTGPVLPVGCHLGDGFSHYVRRPDDIRAGLARIAAAGYGFVRTWFVLGRPDGSPDDYWAGREVGPWPMPHPTPDYWGRLEGFVRDAAAVGLKVHLAAGELFVSEAERRQLFDGLAALMTRVGSERFVLIEGLNEARDTGEPDPTVVEALVRRVRAVHPRNLYALSAYSGHEEHDLLAAWTPTWMEHYQVHGFRGGHVWDKTRHIFSLGYEHPVRRLGWQGEPAGPGDRVSATDHQQELDDESLALMAATAALARQAWCYMSGPGVIWASAPLAAMPGFESVPRLVAMLPRDLMRYERLAHGGDRWAGQRVVAAAGTLRCDHAIDRDGAFVVAIYGPPGAYDVRVERGFEGALIHPGSGRSTPVDGAPGDVLTLTFERGRLLVGRLR